MKKLASVFLLVFLVEGLGQLFSYSFEKVDVREGTDPSGMYVTG